MTGLDLILGRFSRAPKLHGFFFKLACRCCTKSRIGIVLEQRLTRKVVFSSLVLVNWDLLIFFDLTLEGQRISSTRRFPVSVLAIPPRKWAGRIHRELEQQSLGAFSECAWVTVIMDWK